MPQTSLQEIPTPAALWRSWSVERRTPLIEALWDGTDSRPLRISAIQYAARTRNIREAMLQKQAAVAVSRLVRLPTLPPPMATGIARHYLVLRHRDMLAAFLDELQVPHDHGLLPESTEPPSEEALAAAAAAVTAQFPADLVQLYFAVLLDSDGDTWRNLPIALGRQSSSNETDATVAPSPDQPQSNAAEPEPPAPQPPAAPEQPAIAEQPAEADAAAAVPIRQERPGPQSFTHLDELLIHSIVASASRTEGAFDEAGMEEIVKEVIGLSAARHRSFSHLGLLHALNRQPLDPKLPGENPERRLWYLSGAVVGYARERNWEAIVDLYERGELRPLGQTLHLRSQQAAPHIVAALLELRPSAVRAFLSPGLVLPLQCFDSIFDRASMWLKNTRYDLAQPLFELLHESQQDQPLSDEWRERAEDVERRRAHCLQWRGDLKGAERILRRLARNPETRDQAAILTDLAMARAGFPALSAVTIPGELSRKKVFADRLRGVRRELEQATQVNGRSGHAHFCLGVLALLEENAKSSEAAVRHFETALTLFRSDDPLYRRYGLAERCAAYLAIALLETLETVRSESALLFLQEALVHGERLPGHLLQRAVIALESMDQQKGVEQLAEWVLQQEGADALDGLISDERTTCRALLNRLRARGLDERRTSARRMSDLTRVVYSARELGDPEMQGQALDTLQELAHRNPLAPSTTAFLDLLHDRQSFPFDPAWDQSDAAWTAVELHESRGEYRQAALLLRGQFHMILSEGRFGAVNEAADVLDYIESHLREDASDLRARLHAPMTPAAPLSSAAARRVSIAVVGGDQRQAAMQEDICEELRRRDTQISLCCYWTGWSSNWGRQYDNMEHQLKGCDAVVVLRLIRTNLGRLLRRNHPCWIGCAGASPASIVNAVLLGAERAREKPLAARAASNIG